MPDDSNGNFSLVSGYLAVTGQTIQPSQHNPPLEDIATTLTARLSRSGVAPMTGPIKTITGSSSVPAISPNNNPAIGIYWTTTGVAFSGTVSGIRIIGELIPYTFLTAPNLFVFPWGQTLLRTSYPSLWALAQTDIAAGNTFYNNGNGATTFGIGDMRGRVPACKDNMGGTAASRITTAGSGVDGTTVGAVGGVEAVAINASQMPWHYHTAGISDPGHSHNYNDFQLQYGANRLTSANPGYGVAVSASTSYVATGIRANSANGLDTTGSTGSNVAHGNVQPTLVCNYILYVGA